MNRLKDFFYDKNDVIVALVILIIAAIVIYFRIGAIMDYPQTLVDDAASKQAAATQQTAAPATQPTTAAAVKIDLSVDAAAKYLKLGKGSESMYATIGATAGKKYKKGTIEIYQFDIDSDAYKTIEKEKKVADRNVAAYNSGMVLLFANNKTDNNLVTTFNSIDFK